MTSNSTATATARSGGIGFLGLLTILLVAGKIFAPQTATYSWLVAFAPVLVGVGLFLAFVLIALVAGTCLYLADERGRKKDRERRKSQPFR